MLQAKNKLTLEEFLALPEGDVTYELVDGEAIPKMSPKLVIEIISPGQSFGQLASKARDYLDAGVLRVWVVDSQARSITVFYPDAPPQTYMGDTLLIDSLFNGLEITAEQVFRLARI